MILQMQNITCLKAGENNIYLCNSNSSSFAWPPEILQEKILIIPIMNSTKKSSLIKENHLIFTIFVEELPTKKRKILIVLTVIIL